MLDGSQFSGEALIGLKDFSHVEVIFCMHGVDPENVVVGARHPRRRADWPKVGVFAQRVKNRPNRIGVSVCRVVRVEGLEVELESLDAIDGTPVLDLKPWMNEFGPKGEVVQPEWATELMRQYW